MTVFSTLDWSILVVYIIGNLFLGYYLSKRISTAEDFFLGRKNTPWWAIGISVVATYVSALSFLGAPAWSYTEGLSVIAIHLNYPIVIFLVITLFLPFFYNSGVASIYEYQERRFGPRARALISTIWLVSQTLTSAAILYATSLVLEFITGIDVVHAILIVTVIALIYTTLGGITAVIWTDVIQAAVLFVGAFIIFFMLLDNLTLPFAETLSELKMQGKTNPLNFSMDLTNVTTAWSGIVAMTLYHVTVYGTNQMMVQRTLAAKNIGDAKKSYLLMGFAAFFVYFLFIFLGILFYSYYGGAEFENGNTIILQFASEIGIPGLMGIIAAAVMQHYLKATRVFTVFWALVIIAPAIMYSKSTGSILETLSQIGSYFVGAQLGMFALGFFSKHTTERGLLVGTGVGFLIVWYVATNTDIAWPWYCLIGAVANISVSSIASMIMDGFQKEWSPYSIKGQLDKFRNEGLEEKDQGWYVVPGRVDKISYLLLVFFVVVIGFLLLFEQMI